MAGRMMEMGTWQIGCWRWKHGRLDVGDGNMAGRMLEIGTWQAGSWMQKHGRLDVVVELPQAPEDDPQKR